MGRLSGKVAAVTGGASGIGEATARLFAEEGARVAIADLDADRGRAVADEISALFVETRTEREAEAMGFIRRARAELGRLDVLVNNAGMRLYQTVVDASEESWDTILGVNLKGYAFCAKAAIPEMRLTGGGSIVNVASVRSVVVGGNTPQYDTTKAAVAGLTRALAIDHAGEGIRVNAVCPGPIFTRFHERRATTAGKEFEEFKAEFGRNTMLKRPGTPREVAACILFLASDEASLRHRHLPVRGRWPDRDVTGARSAPAPCASAPCPPTWPACTCLAPAPGRRSHTMSRWART